MKIETEPVMDSRDEGVAKHIRRYVETDGAKGHIFHGYPTLLLTTRGRRSGRLRRSALIYGRDGDRFFVVASNGGADHHPAWYLNLIEDSTVAVQVGAETFRARARPASADERTALWDTMVSIFPTYVTYRAKAKREIPVVILERDR